MTAPRIFCDCGGELPRPLPQACPHCGSEITTLRRSYWPVIRAALFVLGLFAVLLLFLWSLVS